ncbi:DNA/RNA non-specific endonuclease [Kamptonema formosum]|uniref:DNA/RNA non-specific endonuclease n=1 Tax=Kamptonema formosum TaxID=331992 RepID=UPI000346FF6F|nr:DNA/RNA non-specific endonuclease [Oscillatoria sp. PCC 10802]
MESVDGPRAGSNIGIIKDPLGPAPQLVAATRPIPKGLTTDLVLSSDEKYLTVSYPGLQLQSSSPEQKGASFIYDVEEIIKAVENPGNYWLDSYSRGAGSIAFNASSKRAATARDLLFVPVDDINPDISVAADYEIIGGNWVNQFTFGVPQDSNRAPIGMVSPKGLTVASARDWVDLVSPGAGGSTDDLTPTFEWKFKDDSTQCGIPNLSPQDISEVNLYVSVFPKDQGLLPKDRWEGLGNVTPGRDYNPNRVLTATWKNGVWTWKGGSTSGDFDEFTLPDERILTAGQTYHWAVEAVTAQGDRKIVTDKFKTLLPQPAAGSNTFSSVTVLSRGLELKDKETDSQFEAMAKHIAETGEGLVMHYDYTNGKWYRKTGTGEDYSVPSDKYGKPLVLIPGWDKRESKAWNAGFAEAAADRLFASLVQLDQLLGGRVGNGKQLYDPQNKLIRTQGAVFNSPLHLIGFGQGATINSELAQRLGTFFPNAGGTPNIDGSPDPKRELQMTMIDAFDPEQTAFTNIEKLYDPKLQIWENVTWADNYYQKATFESDKISSGLSIPQSDLNIFLGDKTNPQTRTGFTKSFSSHNRALGWYSGSADLSQVTFPSVGKDENEVIYRRLGDLELDAYGQPKTPTWYTPDYKNTPFEHGDAKAPWEGVGTGWFYSVLGGGYSKDNSKNLRPLQNYNMPRTPVSYDNTNTDNKDRGDKMRGDYAVPTLFNGNFDAISSLAGSLPIPGWSFQNQFATQKILTAFKTDPQNFVLKLGGDTANTKITHNPFVVPEWGDLRFNLSVPSDSVGGEGKLKVSLNPLNSADGLEFSETISLKPAQGKISSYRDDRYKIGYGAGAGKFETFNIDIPEYLRGKPATLTFKLEDQSGYKSAVYLDDVFFKSELFKWGNPTEARPHRDNGNKKEGVYDSNYLIEKPQYVLSYNSHKNTPNWVSWQVNKSWLTEQKFNRPNFITDPELDETGFFPVEHTDYQEDKTLLPDGYFLIRGHMSAAEDRTRSQKDFVATFLTSNILPHHEKNNGSVWKGLENSLRKEAKANQDFYIIAGGYGTKKYDDYPGYPGYIDVNPDDPNIPTINVPSHVWKVVVRRNLGDPLNKATDAFAVILPNRNMVGEDWTKYKYSINQLESLLNNNRGPHEPEYNFLSELEENRRKELKERNKNSNPLPLG